MSSNGDLSDLGTSDSFWEVRRSFSNRQCCSFSRLVPSLHFCLSFAARELQKDGEADRRRPPAVQRAGQLLPGEGQDREELRSAAERLGQEVEGRGGEG